MNNKLFCYGTLMVPEVFTRISASRASMEAAILPGYRRYQMQGRPYPGLVRSSGSEVQGCLYHGVEPDPLRRLDQYEGPWYKRCLVKVRCAGNKTVLAWCYVIRDFHINKLGNNDWQLQDYMENHLRQTFEQLFLRNENVVMTARQVLG